MWYNIAMQPAPYASSAESKVNDAVLQLRELISRLPTGSRIPSERDLAENWGVARMTARKAIEAVAHEGLLDRRRGAGTFVAPRPQARMRGMSGFTADMVRSGRQPRTETLDFDELTASRDLAEALAVREHDPVFRFRRLRLADEIPIAVETTLLPRAAAPTLERGDLDGSLIDLLTRRFGRRPGQATSTIEAVGAPADVTDYLAVDLGHPCLRVDMRYLDAGRRPLMHAECLYRGDRYHLEVALTAEAIHADVTS